MRVRRRASAVSRSAFTLTEVLIAIAVIVVLIGLLLPALGGVWSSGEMTQSMNHMRQIASWMQQYSSDNNDYVVPSRFDYSQMPYPGKIRSVMSDPPLGVEHSGTWCDVLHGTFEVALYPEAGVALGNDCRFDAPDQALYDLIGESDVRNPFRSVADNSRNWPDGNGDPKPFGPGAQEVGYPGFFAANNFFDAGWGGNPGEHFTNGVIARPEQSMYLVDSWVGETIEPEDEPFEDPDLEVDFRYNGDVCLMLFLDGHVEQQSEWRNLVELEGYDPNSPDERLDGRGVRVRRLTER